MTIGVEGVATIDWVEEIELLPLVLALGQLLGQLLDVLLLLLLTL